jgi:hypothetical protein
MPACAWDVCTERPSHSMPSSSLLWHYFPASVQHCVYTLPVYFQKGQCVRKEAPISRRRRPPDKAEREYRT